MESIDLVGIARPLMEEIRQATKETVSLFMRREFKKICICKLESERSIRYSSSVGELVYLHGGASGKVLMSTFSKEDLDRFEKEEGFKELDEQHLYSKTGSRRSAEKDKGKWIRDQFRGKIRKFSGHGGPDF